MPKSKPFTMRLSPETERWVEREARRAKRSKGAVLEALADEAIRTRRFPGISFRGAEHERRAWLLGTGLDVWEVVEAVQSMGLERLLAEGDLPERKVRLALAYYQEYAPEIDEAIAENRRPEDEWHKLYPSVVPPASSSS